ncbi:hypothetical protein D1007_38303 [Hordeum vulgare]|nr:hypothetical protein D1007_38303 [Hordeum vulgare]
MSNVGFDHANLETRHMHYAGAIATLKKIALEEPPTRLGAYTDLHLIAVFNIMVAMTQRAGNGWYMLPAGCLYPYKYEDTVYHACWVSAVIYHKDYFIWVTYYGTSNLPIRIEL